MTRVHTQGGFSLTEVLVSLSLFSIVAVGLAATTVNTTRKNGTSRDVSAATALVQEKVEQLRALDPAATPPDLSAGNHTDPLNPLTASGITGGSFARTWVVTNDTPSKGLSRVVVTVKWTARQTYSVSGVTYVCTNATCT